MNTINTESASRYAAAPAEKPDAKTDGVKSTGGIAKQNAAPGENLPDSLVQSARYRLMREANALSAESAVADAAMARELTESVRELILGRSAESVRIQSDAIPRGAFTLLD